MPSPLIDWVFGSLLHQPPSPVDLEQKGALAVRVYKLDVFGEAIQREQERGRKESLRGGSHDNTIKRRICSGYG